MMLETERLRLRPFVASDVDAYATRIFADPEVTRYLPKRDALPRDRAQRTMDMFHEHWAHYGYGPWAVVEKVRGVLMGHCGLRLIPEMDETEVLYALGKDFWGRGYATQAAKASVHFGFEVVGLERIIALALPDNIASRRVMEHCGLEYEKDAHIFGLDCVYYALDRGQYQKATKLHKATRG